MSVKTCENIGEFGLRGNRTRMNHCETGRAGFLGQSDILREKESRSLLLKALSVTNGTCPYKRVRGYSMNHKLSGELLFGDLLNH